MVPFLSTAKNMLLQDPIRLITVTAINLCDENQAQQLSLFADENINTDKEERAERAMDDIREKFGDSAISFGSVIKNDIGVE